MTAAKKTAKASAEIVQIGFPNAQKFAAWLRKNHTASPGIWLKIGKKGAQGPSVSYAEALEEALCFGWIDGQKASLDAEAYLTKFTPRGPRSIWSKINRDKADALIASGKMEKAGHAAIAQAKGNGRWEAAYDSQRNSVVPDDLAAALEANPRAKKFFMTLDSANRYAVLWRLHHAKRAETRARKLREFVAMLARGERLHP